MKFGKQDSGVAGLTVLLSLITMLFVMGLLIMIFALMGGEIIGTDTVTQAYTSGSTAQNGITFTDAGTTLTACNGANQGALSTIAVINASSGATVPASNYTASGCTLTSVGAGSLFNATTVNATYTYTYAGSSYTVMNDTVSGISSVTDWYDIFIVIGAMVVLILLTVIIIGAIRGSGLMAGGISSGNGNVGSA